MIKKKKYILIFTSVLSGMAIIFLLIIPLTFHFDPIIGPPTLEFPIQDSNNVTQLRGFNIPNWGEEGVNHNGIDLLIKNYTVVVAPISGIIISITDTINPYAGNMLLKVQLMVNYEWTVSMVFEPGSNRSSINDLQRSLISVHLFQVVSVGDVIGILLDSGEYSHLHFQITHNFFGPFCPYQYSSQSARAIYESIASITSETICYPGLNSEGVRQTLQNTIILLIIISGLCVSVIFIRRRRKKKKIIKNVDV
ncbi:MAG: hypothetical protein ACTSVE_11120 [Candidatus Helarchaeota archaeon]